MYAFGARGDRKHTGQNTYIPGEYLVFRHEPKDVRLASRGSYGFRNTYMLKRRLVRSFRKTRRVN